MRSFVLLLTMASLVLSAPNLNGQESPGPKPAKDSQSLNPPAPRIGKESQPKQNQPKAGNQPPASDNRGTEAAPFVIKILDAPKATLNTDKNKNETNEKPSTDGWLAGVRAEAWAAIFAGIMVLIAGFQLRMFFWQLRLIQVSTTLARDEFISTHRPRINVQGVFIEDSQAEFVIVNTGATMANLIEIRCGMRFGSLPAIPSLLTILDRPPQSLSSGNRVTAYYKLTENDASQFGFLVGGGEPDSKIYFMGRIVYSDNASIPRQRTMAFLRRYDFATGRYVTVDDPDYNYQD